MNRIIKTMVISMLLVIAMPMAKLSAQVSTWDGSWEPWAHGTGTEADPFLIENARQLAYLAYRVNNGLDAGGGHVSNHNLHYKLMIDVDLNGSEDFQWTPIGYYNSYSDYQSFGGFFDGNRHTIYRLYINSSARYVGFWGYTDGATIMNLMVRGEKIAASGNYVGGIVGYAIGETHISNCSNTASVHGDVWSGGIAGEAIYANITDCYYMGNESIISNVDGGIVGTADHTSIINCYNAGDAYGGIIGYIFDPNSSNNNTVRNSYYLNTCGGNNYYGGQSMSADAMKAEEFVQILNNGSEIFTQDTYNVNQGYPIFSGMQYVNVTTSDATDITQTHATLNGTIYTTGSIASCGFKYKKATDSNYQTILASGNGVISSTLSGLETNTEYQYQTFCTLNDGGTYYGETKTFEVTWLNQDTICVYNAEMLLWVSNQCNSGITFEGKYIKLMNDIILPENVPNNMTSIGIYPNYPFKGTFDGNEKLISNLYIDQPNTPYQGFFGYTLNANLYNVGLVNITASGRNYTGGMVAYAENTYLRDCYVNGGTLFALSYCGGLVGYQEQGTNSIISGCYNTCEVTGNNYVGGLVGFSNFSTVRNSYVAGMIAAQGEAVGAIIGGANEVLMYNCYFNAELTGQTNAIGENNTGGGKDGGEAMTSAQMRDPQFVATLNQGLTTPVWKADHTIPINNGFPILKWQYGNNSPCQPPTNLMVNEVGGTYVKLSWQGAADSFVVAYGKDGVYNQTITTTENNIRLEGMQLNTDYVWKIKAICGEHETDYVIGQPFRTLGTGVGENNTMDAVVLPNPTNGKVTIEAENLKHITISNILGQVIYDGKASANEFAYDFSGYEAGVYLIRIETTSGVATKRVVVTR